MDILKNDHITLRALEPEDLDFLFATENNSDFWEVSNTIKPYSRHILKQYLENAHLDIFEAKQLRLLIEENTDHEKIGLIDLFDFNPLHQRVGIGILILDQFRQQGFAFEAIQLTTAYAFKYLNVHQLYANILTENTKSIDLFEKAGFKQTGIKKGWINYQGIFKDVAFYQLIES